MLEYIRIGCAVPAVQVGDVTKNTEEICRYIARANREDCDLLVFPELSVTGYTCADLFFQDALLKASVKGLRQLAEYTANYPHITAVVGAPMLIGGQMYNCAVVVAAGKIRGIIPKTYLPNYNEFSESRWFSSSLDLQQRQITARELDFQEDYGIPVGRDVLFQLGDGTLMGVEVCEDLWIPVPPSAQLALRGAEVIVNLTASNETVGKREYRRGLVRHQSGVCRCIYACASAGCTESTQDLVFSGHSLIGENGRLIAENKKQLDTDYLLIQDADLGKVRAERRKIKSIGDAVFLNSGTEPVRVVTCETGPLRSDGKLYPLSKQPFVPADMIERKQRCMSVFDIQVAGLAQRLRIIGANAVVGVSGGLDSTLALLVAVQAMRQLGRPVTDVHAVTMPCFGTTDRTHRNSLELINALGISAKEVDIGDAVRHHFADIGHDDSVHNATYENAQARERTQVLMDYASVVNGIVVGTGDLSELALGWCTYNGDQMSMYGVNASVPKTLIPWIIHAVSETADYAASKPVLLDILDTPISPELLPPDDSGSISQKTEDIIGPYSLHDFFLYYMLRFGYAPEKIYELACRAFQGEYDAQTVKRWIKVFYRRFFSQQFKRSCMPDGVKVGSISLSPRGDWRMPSDASGRIWLDAVEKL